MSFRIKYLVMLAALAFPAVSSFAQSDAALKRDMAYSRELNAMGLHDFSARFLLERLAAKETKDQANFYRVQLAETYLNSGRNEEAQEIISNIPESDPAYFQSLGALGVYYFLKKDNQNARKLLEKLYNHLKEKKIAPDEYERPLTALLNIYYQEGHDKEATDLLDWTHGSTSDRRAEIYTKALLQLNTAENNRRAELREKAAYQKRFSDVEKDRTKQTELTKLQTQTADLTKAMVNGKGNYNDNVKQRDEAYSKLGALLEMDLDRIKKIEELDLVRKNTSGKVKDRDKWNDFERENLHKKIDPSDWQTTVLAVCADFHYIQWGGQDMLTAYATAQILRCFYLIGEYEEAGVEISRYPDLFEASDEAMEKDGRKSESPAADAKFWTGRSYLALAQQTMAEAASNKITRKEADEKKKQAVIYYRRAFKYLGKLVKYYPQFKDLPSAYRDFKQATEEAMALDTDKRSVYQSEFAKVKAPEMVDQSTLVSAFAEQNYASKQYNLVVDELLPILRQRASRYTPGISELANRLILSYAYQGDSLNAVILGSYMALLPKDDFVTTGLLNAGHVLWKLAGSEPDRARAAQLKGDALTLYRMLLEIDMLNPYAGVVSLRVAREHLNSASRIGARLNASGDPAERAALRKEWQAEVDAAAASYKVIMENFGNNPELTDEAYMKYADCLAMQDDYEGAVETLKQFIAFGPSSLKVAAVAQEIAAEMVSREADRLAERATEIREEAAGDPQQLDKADKLKARAADLYNAAADEILKFRSDLGDGGKYKGVADEPEVAKVAARADSLLPWLYDGAGKHDTAIAQLEMFVEKHKDDPLAPSYLMRVGIIHMETGRDSEARNVLLKLVTDYPQSEEAKNAQYVLARTLYTAGNYSRALSLFEELLSGNQFKDLTLTNQRWMASTLSQCPDETLAKRAAEIALKMCERLALSVQEPNLDEWFTPQRAAELKSDKAAARIAVSRLEQRIHLDAGRAAVKAGHVDRAVAELEKISLLESDSPYFYELHFALAEARELQNRPDEARAELSQVSVRANQTGNYALYDKAQVLTGESFLKSDAVNKAYACFSIIAATAFPEDEEEPGTGESGQGEPDGESPEEDAAARPWIEQAIYRTAYTAALLGLTEERDDMVAKYRKHFPGGKYAEAIGSLPESQAQ